VARDTSVIETQNTEDVTDYAKMFKMPMHPGATEIQIVNDKSGASCDFLLVSIGETKHKLLMRITSESHSRMVDPSRTITKMAHGIHNLKCEHSPVELYRFNELLGRWRGLEGKEKDPEDDASTSSIATLDQETQDAGAGTSDNTCKPGRPFQVTHILDSSFKYNTALALSGDNPIFVCNGDACLNCIFKQATESELPSWTKDYSRWIINRHPKPSNRAPRNQLQLTGHIM